MAVVGRNMIPWLIIPLVLLFIQQAHALMPYRSLLDTMLQGGYSEDPFRILEQTPLSVPKSAVDTVALARADWRETAREHVIWMDIPGVKREDLKIEVEENQVLKISGEMRPAEGKVEGERWHRAERISSGKFWRQFRLPENADTERIRAHLVDGVLKVIVPKVPERKKEAKVVRIEEGRKFGGEDVRAYPKAEM